MSAKQLETIQVKQTMTRVKEEKMPFGWSINPYRGCAHGCSFCYAREFQSFIGLGTDEFQDHILVKDNAAEALQAQLHRMAASRRFDLQQLSRDIGHVAIGTATDPYQPAESSQGVTRECLKVLARYRVPVSITTRSPLILRDIDLLTELNLLSVNISLNSLDERLIRFMEPGSPLPRQRLQALQELVEAGIPVGVFAAPILPLLTDSQKELDELMGVVKAAGAQYMMTSMLRLTPDVKSWYYGVLKEYNAGLLPDYERIFSGAYASRTYTEQLMRMIAELRAKHGISSGKDYPDESSARHNAAAHGGVTTETEVELGDAAALMSNGSHSHNSGDSLQAKLARLRDLPGAGSKPGATIEVLEQMSFPL